MTDKDKPVKEVVEDKKPVKSTAGTVSMPQESYDSIMSRLASLEGKGDEDYAIVGGDDENREFVCRVKTRNTRPISYLHSVKEVGRDSQGESKMECTAVIVEKDGKETEVKKADYLDIIRGGGDEGCKIIKHESEKVVTKGSLVDEKIWDDELGKNIRTGKKAYLAVNSVKTKYLVEWRGEEVWLETLNI